MPGLLPMSIHNRDCIQPCPIHERDGIMSLLMPENTLYFGDNLNILRDNIRDESVDLIYLDLPFNSKANYNDPTSTKNIRVQSWRRW